MRGSHFDLENVSSTSTASWYCACCSKTLALPSAISISCVGHCAVVAGFPRCAELALCSLVAPASFGHAIRPQAVKAAIKANLSTRVMAPHTSPLKRHPQDLVIFMLIFMRDIIGLQGKVPPQAYLDLCRLFHRTVR